MISNDKRIKVKIAIELMKNVVAREARETHSQLQENVATLVARETEKRLDRKCNGDDDQVFYAAEQQLVASAWNLIENELRNLLNS